MADPFQPKFVDLVRNYSTTVGTGNFVLGPAVNGHSSLATALTVGDNFYYSAIGVDKPAEREVGRGQLLADGTISRTPVSGPPTSFTAGNKTIALIAAAEWFTTVQAGGSGTQAAEAAASAAQAATSASEAAASSTSANSASTAAGTAKVAAETARTGAETAKAGANQAQSGAQLAETGALEAEAGAEAARDAAIAAGGSGGGQAAAASRAALAGYATTAPVILTEAGRDGLFVWDSANLSAKVTLDTYQAIYVAPTSDTTGASGAWVRRFAGPIELGWFGVADGAASNAARVESAIGLLSTTRGPVLRFPFGQVTMDATVDVSRCCIIEGHGGGTSTSGTNASAATLLIFPAGSNGFRIHNAAQNTILRQMRITGAGALASTGTASYTAGSYTVTLGAAGDFANGQTIWLEGAGPSITLQDRIFSTTNGSAVVTWTVNATDADGATPYFGNSVGYIGQQISIAGAGFPAGTYISSWGIGTATLSANATATVSGAAATIKGPLVSEIASGGGTTTLTLTSEPHAPQSVAGAVIRHGACGIYSTIQCHTADLEVMGNLQVGMALCGITTGGSVADSCSFTNSYFFGTKAGVVLQGADANVNTFLSCNFAGPEVGVMDNSFLGNDYVSCHWAFNNGIQVGYTGANVKIVGGYFETGTSWIAPGNGQAKAYGTTSMVNGSGFTVLVQGSGTTYLGDVRAKRGYFNNGLVADGSSASWFSGNINFSAKRFGETASGWVIGGNGAAGPNSIVSQFANGTYCLGNIDASELKFGTTYGGTQLAWFQTSGLTVPALVSAGSVAATGTVSGSNLSGTNSGDQFTAMTSARLLGRVTAGVGNAEQLTAAQVKALLAIGTVDVSGLAAIATSGSGADLAAGSVTYAKLQNAAASRLIGNATGVAGAPGEVALGANLGFSGSNIQVQLTASAKLLGRTTAGTGASEEIGVANGVTLTAGTLGLGAITPTSVAATGAITSTGGGVGYATGAGGAVTQTTNKAAAVTLHKLSGSVTMHGASMAAAAIVEFTVNNSQIVIGDTINLNLASGAANSINYRYWVSAVGSGLFKIVVENRSAGALAEALVLNFAAFKAVTA